MVMNLRLFRSVRVSLTLWYVGALVGVLALYAGAVFMLVGRNLSESLNEQLRSDFQSAVAMADRGPDGSLTWYDEDRNGGVGSHWLQVWGPDGKVFRTAVAERNPISESDRLTTQAERYRIVAIPTAGTVVRILTGDATIFDRRVVIQVARPEDSMRNLMRQLTLLLALGLPLGVGTAGVGGYWLARRALAPVDRMAERARSITAERLHERLPADHLHDEFGRLAAVFNETLGRLEASFDQTRRFTADVSHELRTPLTAIRSVGEVGLRRDHEATEYCEIISSMLEEADRLASLVDRLLAFSRAELGQVALTVEAVNLRNLVEQVAADLGVLAEEKQQLLVVEAEGWPHVLNDRLILRQSLINLVDNAIKYTAPGGRIRIRLAESPTGAQIEVIDNGPGIPDGLRSRIFDRHYRGTRLGSPLVGGCGLGLSIAKWSTEISGGQLSFDPTVGGGSTFRITLVRKSEGRPEQSHGEPPADHPRLMARGRWRHVENGARSWTA
jgi:signal transduction histidine kinase